MNIDSILTRPLRRRLKMRDRFFKPELGLSHILSWPPLSQTPVNWCAWGAGSINAEELKEQIGVI